MLASENLGLFMPQVGVLSVYIHYRVVNGLIPSPEVRADRLQQCVQVRVVHAEPYEDDGPGRQNGPQQLPMQRPRGNGAASAGSSSGSWYIVNFLVILGTQNYRIDRLVSTMQVSDTARKGFHPRHRHQELGNGDSIPFSNDEEVIPDVPWSHVDQSCLKRRIIICRNDSSHRKPHKHLMQFIIRWVTMLVESAQTMMILVQIAGLTFDVLLDGIGIPKRILVSHAFIGFEGTATLCC